VRFKERFTSEIDAVDDVYGDYPFALYGEHFITRRNLVRFCKEMTDIDSRLTLVSHEDKMVKEHLEFLCMEKLHLITVNFWYYA